MKSEDGLLVASGVCDYFQVRKWSSTWKPPSKKNGVVGVDCTHTGQLGYGRSTGASFRCPCVIRLDLRRDRKSKYRINRGGLMAWAMALLAQFLAHKLGLLTL
ncbi:hypothetical protein VP01_533g4 [Puccinia sorghi]|uniref:Uncharacterized protein n=1 Tax=Puccinia sorghi TaxID=27349 RepID=A0A0L6UK36_9BASI|nr:hypothetical protein VP01_533g4 [Puccinia sorghi]